MTVTETIRYDFGGNSKHGIIRYIPTKFPYDKTHYRVYPISDVQVGRDGQGEQFSVDSGNYLVVKIGSPNRTLSGEHTYVIRYDVAYSIDTFADHDELYWNAVGNEWPVPIAQTSVTVTSDVPVLDVTCFAGPQRSSLGCDEHSFTDKQATFSNGALAAMSGVTVVVAAPPGSIAAPGPRLTKRWSLATAFTPNVWTIGGGLLLLLLGVGGALLIAYLFGRDRHYVGILPGLTPEFDDPNVEQRKPFIGARRSRSSSPRRATCGRARWARSSTSGPTWST